MVSYVLLLEWVMIIIMHALLSKISIFFFGIISTFFPVNYTAPQNIYTPEAHLPTPVVQITNSTTTNKTLATKTTSNDPITNKMAVDLLGIKESTTTTSVTTPTAVKILPKTLIPLETLNDSVRLAMVNILCTTKIGGYFNPISGSGVVIDKRGVILTNAHVAQYMLLKNYGTKDFMTCVARTGSPATPSYKVELLYLPENWLSENAKMIKQTIQEGTGENDYALLLITGSLTNNPLPSSYPFVGIDINQEDITGDIPVLLTGYPANFLGGITTQRDLWLVSSPSYLTKIFYYSEKNNIDGFSVGANIIAQKGVSGGAAVNQWTGRVGGILTTISGGDTTGTRDLSAISLAHISRSFKDNTDKDLVEFLAGDLTNSLKNFTENTLPGQIKILVEALESTDSPTNR